MSEYSRLSLALGMLFSQSFLVLLNIFDNHPILPLYRQDWRRIPKDKRLVLASIKQHNQNFFIEEHSWQGVGYNANYPKDHEGELRLIVSIVSLSFTNKTQLNF